MEPVNYLAALRRRWRLIVAAVIAAAALGAILPLPRDYVPPGVDRRYDLGTGGGYRATARIGVPPLTADPAAAIQALVFYAGNSDVARKTAKAVHLVGDPNQISGAIHLTPVVKLGIIQVSGTAREKADAIKLVNAYDAALSNYLAKLTVTVETASTRAAKQRVDSLHHQLQALGARIKKLVANNPAAAQGPSPQVASLQAQRRAVVAAYQTAYQTYANIAAGTAAAAPRMVVLQPASDGNAASVSGGLSALVSRRKFVVVVLMLLALFGAALLALMLEHFDRRIRSRAAAAAAAGVPVLAEIPRQRGFREEGLPAATSPRSAAAEAYRVLRAVLTVWHEPASAAPTGRQPKGPQPTVRLPGQAPEGSPSTPAPPRPAGSPSVLATTAVTEAPAGTSPNGPAARWRGRRIVVTSVGDERTRPTVVANLAASFAETGQTVAVVNAGGGSTGGSVSPGQPIGSALRPSSVAGVRTVDLAECALPDGRPAIHDAAAAVDEIAGQVDIVVIDAPPLFRTHAVAALSPVADDLALVVEHRTTTTTDTAKCVQDLTLIHAPLRGVVLTNVPSRRVAQPRPTTLFSDGREGGHPASEPMA